MATSVRIGRPEDLAAIVSIQDASGELSPWTPESLASVLAGDPAYGLWVADLDTRVGGFLLWRALPGEESEILSLAVEFRARRQGLARALLQALFRERRGECFLEVRVSNLAAQALYRAFGFEGCGLRRAYYHRPVEDALMMRRPAIFQEKAT